MLWFHDTLENRENLGVHITSKAMYRLNYEVEYTRLNIRFKISILSHIVILREKS